jgi:hypothetical protein
MLGPGTAGHHDRMWGVRLGDKTRPSHKTHKPKIARDSIIVCTEARHPPLIKLKKSLSHARATKTPNLTHRPSFLLR